MEQVRWREVWRKGRCGAKVERRGILGGERARVSSGNLVWGLEKELECEKNACFLGGLSSFFGKLLL
jgi:hypothetical protein